MSGFFNLYRAKSLVNAVALKPLLSKISVFFVLSHALVFACSVCVGKEWEMVCFLGFFVQQMVSGG